MMKENKEIKKLREEDEIELKLKEIVIELLKEQNELIRMIEGFRTRELEAREYWNFYLEKTGVYRKVWTHNGTGQKMVSIPKNSSIKHGDVVKITITDIVPDEFHRKDRIQEDKEIKLKLKEIERRVELTTKILTEKMLKEKKEKKYYITVRANKTNGQKQITIPSTSNIEGGDLVEIRLLKKANE